MMKIFCTWVYMGLRFREKAINIYDISRTGTTPGLALTVLPSPPFPHRLLVWLRTPPSWPQHRGHRSAWARRNHRSCQEDRVQGTLSSKRARFWEFQNFVYWSLVLHAPGLYRLAFCTRRFGRLEFPYHNWIGFGLSANNLGWEVNLFVMRIFFLDKQVWMPSVVLQ